MRILLFILTFFFYISSTFATTDSPIVCTMQYAPVCGSVQVQCITSPCEQVRQTFGNSCMANAANATQVTDGECPSSPIVGSDLDKYGCKASAGYSWDSTLAQCIRIWEKPITLVTWAYDKGLTRYTDVSSYGYERSLTRQEAAAIITRAGEKLWGLRYASYPDNCSSIYSDDATFDPTLKNDIYTACALNLMYGQLGIFSPFRTLSRAEALAIIMRGIDGGKKDESGAIWYKNYADQAYKIGMIASNNLSIFDQAITRGELLEWIYSASKYMEKKNTHITLLGEWTLVQFNDTPTTSTVYTLRVLDDTISTKFCNNISGSYIAKDNIFIAPALISTMMYCEGFSMVLENAFVLDGATYSVSGPRFIDGKTDTKTTLSIKTTKGDIYTYRK